MFETIFRERATIARHRAGPYVDERECYLHHCAAVGATAHSQRASASATLRISHQLTPADQDCIDAGRLWIIAERCTRSAGPKAADGLAKLTRPWLKFLGWWHEPRQSLAFAVELDRFVSWMRDERGLTPCTVEQWRGRTAIFLRWCEQHDLELASLAPEDIDRYFICYGASRWSRISAGHIATMLRVFLRHAATQGFCSARLANSIIRPRRYSLEMLPYALDWTDVGRLIASASGDTELDVRDLAIMLLMAVYGLRRGEVAALRLDNVDHEGSRLHIWRLKRQQPQVYPLAPSVAQALRRYIDCFRPPVTHPQVFITAHAPRSPISATGIYGVVNRRLRALHVQAAHLGPHALRHACASKLLAEGLTLKEIGDHLGHRSASSTSIYAKVDMAGLRMVGEFDLGELQ
jgi:integrase/recombinase XerD